jgi:peptide/nickel transport system substrate-binding protein
MTTIKIWRVAFLLTVVAILSISCGGTAPAADTDAVPGPEPEEGGEEASEEAEAEAGAADPTTLRVAMSAEYLGSILNPLNAHTYGVLPVLHERLVEATGVISVKPALAESWEVSDDGKTWTLKIREGVTFHDGTPCTAEDIAWSLNFMIDNEFSATSAFVSGFVEATAPDPTTLVITTEDPIRDLPQQRLTYCWILPRSVWEGLTYDEAVQYSEPDVMVGTGPYKAVEFKDSEYLVVEAFEDYWRGKPEIERVVLQVYANPDAAVQALLAGEIDLIETVSYTAIGALEGEENITLVPVPAPIIHELTINMYEPGNGHKALLDPDVRLAIAHATDKQQVVNVAYLGYAAPATVHIPPAFGQWHNPNMEDVPFDIAEGNRILDEAGYLDTDDDGIRETPDGEPLEFSMVTDMGPTGIRALDVISEGLGEIGIAAFPNEVNDISELYPEFEFDLHYWWWWYDPSVDEPLRAHRCSELPDGWNETGFCNEEYDDLYIKQNDPLVSDEERQEMIWRMQELFYNERGYVITAYVDIVYAYRNDRFTGFSDEFAPIFWPHTLLQIRPVQ